MEKKDTLSSCSESEEQQMQLIQDKSKESCMHWIASLVVIESNGTESQEQDTSSKSGNDAHVDDADIRPIYNEEPMAEVQTTAEINIFATGQHHTDHCNITNKGKDDQKAENVMKYTVAQFQKDFSRMEAHCVNLELKYQNQVLKEGQQGQFLNVKSNEAKVKHDIDVIETINIELEHKVAKLLKENETLKRHYKEMFDSIKTTRAKNIEHTTSLIANNDKFKAQLQEKGFAIAAFKKNELRKLTGNSVNTKYSLKYKYIVQSYKGRTQSLVAEKTDISENRASRNFDLMIIKWRLLKITLQAPSSLVLHQMTSDHNRSELGIQDYSNEQSSSKLVPKVVP
ncbi:hypothetical protein Tco_0829141 [Tanacetum coccineum]